MRSATLRSLRRGSPHHATCRTLANSPREQPWVWYEDRTGVAERLVALPTKTLGKMATTALLESMHGAEYMSNEFLLGVRLAFVELTASLFGAEAAPSGFRRADGSVLPLEAMCDGALVAQFEAEAELREKATVRVQEVTDIELTHARLVFGAKRGMDLPDWRLRRSFMFMTTYPPPQSTSARDDDGDHEGMPSAAEIWNDPMMDLINIRVWANVTTKEAYTPPDADAALWEPGQAEGSVFGGGLTVTHQVQLEAETSIRTMQAHHRRLDGFGGSQPMVGFDFGSEEGEEIPFDWQITDFDNALGGNDWEPQEAEGYEDGEGR